MGNINKKRILNLYKESLEKEALIDTQIDSLYVSQKMSRMRSAIAKKTSKCVAETAQYYIKTSINMSAVVNGRDKINEILKEKGIKVTFNDIIVKSVANSLTDVPELNIAWGDSLNIQKAKHINIGIVVKINEGMMIPVLKDVDKMNIIEVAMRTKQLINKTLTGMIKPDELNDGTFTISNLGQYDIDFFTAILNQPQAGILAIGKITKRPYVLQDKIEIGSFMDVCLTVDHRIIDGSIGAVFLQSLKDSFENCRFAE